MGLVAAYFDEISKVFASGVAREHGYRPALERLFNALHDDIQAINEPGRSDVGAPDFIFYDSNHVAIGVCEAKDIDKGLETLTGYSVEQKQRYLKGFPNLIYTNALDFEFYRDGELIRKIKIGELLMGLVPIPEAFDELEAQLKDFVTETPRTITHSKRLAEFMAAKAAIIKDVMGRALVKDLEGEGSELTAQYHAFKEHLIHDIDAADFADIYAETIAYGMFAARLHDTSLDTFSREEALTLLPKSNPFLRSLFGYIAGQELDDRIAWIIDDLAKIFLATNLQEIMADFGKLTGQNDPFLHFYETFLSAYNPAKRKARGVWYTPEPVVNFIVRAVDEVLQTEFGLADGLADTSKITVDWETGQTDKKGKRITEKKEVHRVQILDPATGTGTFLAEVIKLIAGRVKGVAPGMWSQYIEQELLPRLHGFELLMASYAMCHMKIDMILSELGYRPSGEPPRLSVWLTNSLEEGEPADQSLPFARWLSNETKGANTIKRDKPIMCVIGNPPYSGESANKGEWIMSLMEAYKKEPGGRQRLREKTGKWINDDYVKFIRFAEYMIEKNGEGVLGFITNHGYLDNPTFRGMRWHLLQTFDRIYVLDLHGNAKKKEVSPDGSADKNVFDIQQGVAIIIAVKNKNESTDSAQVLHVDVWGNRANKYKYLEKSKRSDIVNIIQPSPPYFLLEPWDLKKAKQYECGFGVTELFPEGGSGVVTKRDKLTIHKTRDSAWEAVQAVLYKDEAEVRKRYSIPADVRDWRYEWAKNDVANLPSRDKIQPISYRPFDQRYIYYTGRSRGFVGWPVDRLMRNFIIGENIGLATARSNKNPTPDHFFVTKFMMETKYAESSTQSAVFPLYLYPEEDSLDQTRRVNFEPKIWKKIREAAGVNPRPSRPATRAPQDEGIEGAAPGEAANEVDIFDYIYGVLHSPDYRETFKEFLKIDFPRIPYPSSPDVFWHVAEKGGELRRLHLMEDAAIGETPYPFEGEGDGVVDKPVFDNGKVWINAGQGFAGVPAIAWAFYIGGYQPAQKWLKDRKGRTLSFADIKHYQKIIKILSETDRIMKDIKLPIEA